MGSTRLSKVDTGNKRIGDTMRCIFGTNRTNATARTNLMTGASLGYSGYYNGVSLLAVGEYGYWWSSTIRNANSYSYLLRIGYDNIGPQYSLNKYVGRAVRCVNQT